MESRLSQAERRNEELQQSQFSHIASTSGASSTARCCHSDLHLCCIFMFFLSPIKSVIVLILECPFQAITFVMKRSVGLECDELL